MTRGKSWSKMMLMVALPCGMAVGCAASTLEPQEPSQTAAAEEEKPASAQPANDAHGMDVDVEWQGDDEGSEEAEPQRDRTPPPTRTYSPMNKMD